MAKAAYIGVDGVARKVKKMYIGVDGMARKVKKAYVGVDGVARQFFSAEFMTYTGAYTVSQVEYNGKTCNLYTLTKSGVLTLNDSALFWMCGGGSGGSKGDDSPGGGGGGGYVNSGSISSGDYVITIGAAGGTTKIGDVYTADGGKKTDDRLGGDGGCGGGGGGIGSATVTSKGGTGARKTTYPFGITDLKAHCAGGGGGSSNSVRSGEWLYYYGGHGGSGGSYGNNGNTSYYIDYDHALKDYLSGGSGGTYGGGTGGAATTGNGTKGTFYGAGGGGNGVGVYKYAPGYADTHFNGTAGAGYQGVVYILQIV